jgi:hypothetical protein
MSTTELCAVSKVMPTKEASAEQEQIVLPAQAVIQEEAINSFAEQIIIPIINSLRRQQKCARRNWQMV